jgi:hypothetical protein|tara:strand:+ start:2936 stop:3457 length:522 start_codon:yes stop_codon:yes gene_type:complete
MEKNMEKDIYKKLYNVQLEIGVISKDVTNPFYKSKYFDINSLIAQLHPLLKKHGLLLLQPIEDQKVKSMIVEINGDGHVESSIRLPDMQDPQKLGSAITYYRRYTLQSLLALQAEDDDGNKAIVKKKSSLKFKTPEFYNAQKGIREGASLDDVRKVYSVSPEVQEKLLNFKLD